MVAAVIVFVFVVFFPTAGWDGVKHGWGWGCWVSSFQRRAAPLTPWKILANAKRLSWWEKTRKQSGGVKQGGERSAKGCWLWKLVRTGHAKHSIVHNMEQLSQESRDEYLQLIKIRYSWVRNSVFSVVLNKKITIHNQTKRNIRAFNDQDFCERHVVKAEWLPHRWDQSLNNKGGTMKQSGAKPHCEHLLRHTDQQWGYHHLFLLLIGDTFFKQKAIGG